MANDASGGVNGTSALAAGRILISLAMLIAIAVTASPAVAGKIYPFKETFGNAVQPSFTAPQGIAVDQSSGDVLVIDGGAKTVSRFKADGTPSNFPGLGTNVIDGKGNGNCATVPAECDQTPQNGLGIASQSESQIAVDNSGTATDGNIYVTQSFPNAINIFSEEGKYLGQLTAAGATNFSEACGVAVDPSGAVYVGDYTGGIRKFVPAANPPVNADNTATFSSVALPCTLSAGAGPTAGFLFAATFNGPISKLDSTSGALKYTVSSDNNRTLFVNPGAGGVYAATGNSIKEFDASGAGSAAHFSTVPLANAALGVAVHGASGNLYASRSGNAKLEVFGPGIVVPTVTTGAASSVGPTSAIVNGTVNPDGIELTGCKFEYGKTTSYGQSVPCAQSNAAIGSGTADVSVSANLSSLDLGAEYHFRLVAANPNGSVNGADASFKLQSPPVIKESWTASAVFDEAKVAASINPEGSSTTYKVEYGTTPAYGESTAEKGVGSDKALHGVSNDITGLVAGTTYHWRVVATNSIGTSQGPDRTFTTFAHEVPDGSCPNQSFRGGPAAFLPDCRAYEMVSPVDKEGGEIVGLQRSALSVSSLDGEQVTYTSYRAFANAKSAPFASQYISSRGPEGWTTDNITPPRGEQNPGGLLADNTNEFQGFTPDLSKAWLVHSSEPLTPDASQGYDWLYERNNNDDSYNAMFDVTPPNLNVGEFFEPEFQGATSDGSHVLFVVADALTPDAPFMGSNNYNLYEVVEGKVRLVSILPNGNASTWGNSAGTDNGPSTWGREAFLNDAISDDGSRIFWSTAESSVGTPVRQKSVYVRIDGETTLPVSETVSGDSARFWGASADGSKALIAFGGQDNADLGGAEKGNLYIVDVDSETPTLIAGGSRGVLGAAADLSYVYYASTEALDAGATAGQPNLYLYREGSSQYIAPLSMTDTRETHQNGIQVFSTSTSFFPSSHSATVTPDGRQLVFTSELSLTGYDSVDQAAGQSARQVYIYDAEAGELICASCNPSGARPTGSVKQGTEFNGFVWDSATTVAWEESTVPAITATNPRHLLSPDGNRLFFNSYDALLPRDSNGKEDVYQWQAQGVDGCTRGDGCISLISTGDDPGVAKEGGELSSQPQGAELIDASADGDTVFFVTSSSIDPRDPGLLDIYAARVEGGFPGPEPSGLCEGDSCASPPDPPNDPTPASASFRGAGDPKPSQARRRRCSTRNVRHAKKGSRDVRKAAKRCKRTKREAKR